MGSLTVTNRRVIYDMEDDPGQDCGRMTHQEARISDISSIRSFVRSPRGDRNRMLAMLVVGLLLIALPFSVLALHGDLALSGDAQAGYNDGFRYGYYNTYVESLGDVEKNTIPHGTVVIGYDPKTVAEFTTEEYAVNYIKGCAEGVLKAAEDVLGGKAFSIPGAASGWASIVVVVTSILGLIIVIIESKKYADDTKESKAMVAFDFMGDKRNTLMVKSMETVYDATKPRDFISDDDVPRTINELGALILNAKMGVRPEDGLRAEEPAEYAEAVQ